MPAKPFIFGTFGIAAAPSIVDSYSETNRDSFSALSSGTSTGVGQSFTGVSATLDSVQFYLSKNNLPTGNIVAKIYAHTGVFGTSSTPTGAALATSGTFDVSTLTGSYALTTFTFSGAERISLSATNYVVTVEVSGAVGDASNYVRVGADGSTPTHAGNLSYNDGSWNAVGSDDNCFYVYGI
jgi:hypothetical protein